MTKFTIVHQDAADLQRRGVSVPPGSGFWYCIQIEIDQHAPDHLAPTRTLDELKDEIRDLRQAIQELKTSAANIAADATTVLATLAELRRRIDTIEERGFSRTRTGDIAILVSASATVGLFILDAYRTLRDRKPQSSERDRPSGSQERSGPRRAGAPRFHPIPNLGPNWRDSHLRPGQVLGSIGEQIKPEFAVTQLIPGFWSVSALIRNRTSETLTLDLRACEVTGDLDSVARDRASEFRPRLHLLNRTLSPGRVWRDTFQVDFGFIDLGRDAPEMVFLYLQYVFRAHQTPDVHAAIIFLGHGR